MIWFYLDTNIGCHSIWFESTKIKRLQTFLSRAKQVKLKRNRTKIHRHIDVNFERSKKPSKLNSQWIPILWARCHRQRLHSLWWKARKHHQGVHHMICHRRQMKSKYTMLFLHTYFSWTSIWNKNIQFFISHKSGEVMNGRFPLNMNEITDHVLWFELHCSCARVWVL